MVPALSPDALTAFAMTGLASLAAAWLVWLRGHANHWHQGVPQAVAAALALGLAHLLLAVQTRIGVAWLELAARGLLSLAIAGYTLALVRFSHRGSRRQDVLVPGLPLLLTGVLALLLLPAQLSAFALLQGGVALAQLAYLLRVLRGIAGASPSVGWRVVYLASWVQALAIVPLLSWGWQAMTDAGPARGMAVVLGMWLACVVLFMHVIVHSVGFLMLLRDRQALVERELAVRDSLTGLSNRSALLEGLQRAMAVARQDCSPLAVLMVDIDHFKQLNDLHGHLAGDQAIRQTAGVLAEQARQGDLVGRYGGEEFVLVLPNTPLGQASAIAQRLCQAVRGKPLQLPGQGPLPLSVSIGVHAGVPSVQASWQHLIAAADAAMYRAKQDGRDRVALDSPQA